MVGGAFVFGAGVSLVNHTPLAALIGGMAGLAVGASLAHGRWMLRLALAAAAVLPLCFITPTWGALAGSAAVGAVGLALGGPRGWRGLAGLALGAVATLAGMWCAVRVATAREVIGWPGVLVAAASAAAMGMVGVLALLPRHLSASIDPVRAALRALPAGLDAEVRALCDRSAAIWTTAKERMADESGALLMRDGVLRTLEVAAKSSVPVAGPTEAELKTRMADLDGRIAASTDAEVVAQYQAARAALDDQQRYQGRIRQGRERLVARMHNHVAALEKFQLAASGLEATRASEDVIATNDALLELAAE